MSKKAVVTGVGVLASNGSGKNKFWDSLCQGKSGTRKLTRFNPNGFPADVAGEVQDFHPEAFIDDKLLLKRLDRFSQFSVASVRMALEDAAPVLHVERPDVPPARVGT